MKVWIIKSSDNQGKNFSLFLKKNVLNMTQVATMNNISTITKNINPVACSLLSPEDNVGPGKSLDQNLPVLLANEYILKSTWLPPHVTEYMYLVHLHPLHHTRALLLLIPAHQLYYLIIS